MKKQNSTSLKYLKSNKAYETIYQNTLAILNDQSRIPYATERAGYYYNFWTDANHVRGIYRRTTLEEYQKWETILDLDALAKAEGENWVYGGIDYHYPKYERCLLSLSRGGGEYGPRWHQAALKENRHKAYEDFEAVAEQLIADKVTKPQHLGIQGGSNGGLLMGAAFTRRPDLYNAVICQVPLLDMKRFNKLLAGASWMGEYGNPDTPAEWEYIKTYSPYHNLSKDKQYPKVFFTTSTRDDRVHPGHARKMVAKMQEMGFDVLYFENTEGGHAGAANNEQRAMVTSLEYVYLMDRLK